MKLITDDWSSGAIIRTETKRNTWRDNLSQRQTAQGLAWNWTRDSKINRKNILSFQRWVTNRILNIVICIGLTLFTSSKGRFSFVGTHGIKKNHCIVFRDGLLIHCNSQVMPVILIMSTIYSRVGLKWTDESTQPVNTAPEKNRILTSQNKINWTSLLIQVLLDTFSFLANSL